jgi:hypothetical protein
VVEKNKNLQNLFCDYDGLLVSLTRLREGFDENAHAQCAIFAGNHQGEARLGAGQWTGGCGALVIRRY